MASDTKHLEVTLDTHVESVNLAEEMCLRVAESAGFGEDDCYRIGMSVREGVINAFHYGNQERPDKKIHLAVDITPEKMIIHVLDEGKGFDLKGVPDPLAQENLLSTSGCGSRNGCGYRRTHHPRRRQRPAAQNHPRTPGRRTQKNPSQPRRRELH